jgi:hypothetical protein
MFVEKLVRIGFYVFFAQNIEMVLTLVLMKLTIPAQLRYIGFNAFIFYK